MLLGAAHCRPMSVGSTVPSVHKQKVYAKNKQGAHRLRYFIEHKKFPSREVFEGARGSFLRKKFPRKSPITSSPQNERFDKIRYEMILTDWGLFDIMKVE